MNNYTFTLSNIANYFITRNRITTFSYTYFNVIYSINNNIIFIIFFNF